MFDESAEKENIGDFSGVTPARQAVPTPNTVIATPSRTPGMATPGRGTLSSLDIAFVRFENNQL